MKFVYCCKRNCEERCWKDVSDDDDDDDDDGNNDKIYTLF